MNMLNGIVKRLIMRYGVTIVSCAYVFVSFAANTACSFPFYEPKEPQGMERFCKISRKSF